MFLPGGAELIASSCSLLVLGPSVCLDTQVVDELGTQVHVLNM